MCMLTRIRFFPCVDGCAEFFLGSDCHLCAVGKLQGEWEYQCVAWTVIAMVAMITVIARTTRTAGTWATQCFQFIELFLGLHRDDFASFVDHLERHHDDRAVMAIRTAAIEHVPVADGLFHLFVAGYCSGRAVAEHQRDREYKLVASADTGA